MKKYIIIVFTLSFLITGIIFTSCSMKDKLNENTNEPITCSGVPTITDVGPLHTTLHPGTAGDTLKSSLMNDWIIIHGTNLCAVKRIKFNDVVTPDTSYYISNPSEIVCRVPRVVPVNIDNKLKVYSNNDSASIAYSIAVPPLTISGALLEYVAVGGTMYITGANFDLYHVSAVTGKVKFGNVEAPVVRMKPDTLVVVVPVGATAGDSLTIVPDNPALAKGALFRYMDHRNIIYDADNGVYGDAAQGVRTDGSHASDVAPLPGGGNYVRLTVSNSPAWDWKEICKLNVTNTVTNWAGYIPDDAYTNPQNYLFKLEFNSILPFGNRYLGVWFGDNLDASGLIYDTHGQWRTVSIPFNTIFHTPKTPGTMYFNLVLRGDGAGINIDWAIDNIRVIKYR